MPVAETAGWMLYNALLLFVMMKLTVWLDSFAGPALIEVAHPPTLCAAASSSTDWFAPLVKLGTSFTALTVIVNVWVALVSTPPLDVPPLSWIWTLTVVEPFAFAAGV